MASEKVLIKKREIIEKIKENKRKYKFLGIVDFSNLPARQLQELREKLGGKAKIFMAKKSLIRIALNELEAEGFKNIYLLSKYLEGQPAIIFTGQDPFKLFKILKQNQSKAPIKPGQVAPEDIIIKAGKTNFSPGPIIGELGSIGIKTKVESGKVAIVEDKVVAKKGDVVDAKLASILQRLGIEPMKIGLKLNSIWDNGVIYTQDVLDISLEDIINEMALFHTQAISLSLEIGYPTKDNINFMIENAARESICLALFLDIPTKETINYIISKAQLQAIALKNCLKEG